LVWVRTVFTDTNSWRAMSGAVGVTAEQPEHVQLARTQRFDQASRDRRAVPTRPQGRQESAGVARGGSLRRGCPQQDGHGRALVQQEPDVALPLGQGRARRSAASAAGTSPRPCSGVANCNAHPKALIASPRRPCAIRMSE
jgi:hypothetical protein